jgi:tRNA (guanine37-N1)-methyltransferase
MRIDVITAFPDLLAAVFGESILKKAQEKNSVAIRLWDLREFARDKHKTVDDYPYGGGAGMVMKPEPIFRAIDEIRKEVPGNTPVILMSPQGERFSQRMAEEMSLAENWIFICGHYRGVDERVIETLVTREISIGDYILTGGELPAAVIVDAVVRLLPGVLGDMESAEGDSFSNSLLDHPHYTRPENYRGMKVPDVLLSGHHAHIEKWRMQKAVDKTRRQRPDLLE